MTEAAECFIQIGFTVLWAHTAPEQVTWSSVFGQALFVWETGGNRGSLGPRSI